MDAANVLLPIRAGEPKPVDIGQGMSGPRAVDGALEAKLWKMLSGFGGFVKLGLLFG